MLTSAQTAPPIAGLSSNEEALPIPWYCFAAVFGAACIPVGALWDISWHSTIGRDTFWTPAHILIYLGGVIPGCSCGWLVWMSTFGRAQPDHLASVRIWGLRGPMGAWVVIWGAIAMLTSAPLDDWWHNAYGLDVEILSPPHTVLAAGMYAVAVGSLLLVLSCQNRLSGTAQRTCGALFVINAGVLLAMSTIIVTEESFPNQQHAPLFYQISCAIYPLYLVATARASRVRWPATGTALVYTTLMLLMVWILPLFPAEPKLAPIYNPVDRMVPPAFPLLLIAPALAIDLLMQALGRRAGWWRDWGLALLLGAAFLGIFLPVQWYFSEFLLSPSAENWFFSGNQHWPYFVQPGDWRYRFWKAEQNPMTWGGLALALTLAIVKSRVALGFGNWMSKVRR